MHPFRMSHVTPSIFYQIWSALDFIYNRGVEGAQNLTHKVFKYPINKDKVWAKANFKESMLFLLSPVPTEVIT